MSDPRYPIGRYEPPADVSAAARQGFIEQIEQAPAALAAAVAGLDDDQLDTPYREGGWTARQVVHHVAESLTGYPDTPIQDAIDLASPGDLILVSPGNYNEMVIMWKPVQLQGWGSYSTIINANKLEFDTRTQVKKRRSGWV